MGYSRNWFCGVTASWYRVITMLIIDKYSKNLKPWVGMICTSQVGMHMIIAFTFEGVNDGVRYLKQANA